MDAATLIRWRKRMDMTQEEAAEALGCSRRSLGSYERGEADIPRYIGLACSALMRGQGEYEEH